MSASRELFRALELAHYAERFRDRIFVIAVSQPETFSELLLDFKVLAGYHVQVVLVIEDPALELDRVMATANKRGARFRMMLLTELLMGPEGDAPSLDFSALRDKLRRGLTPVIAFHGADEPDAVASWDAPEPTFAVAAQLAARLEAQKLFLLQPRAGEMRHSLPRSHVLAGELGDLPRRLATTGLPGVERLVRFIRTCLERGIPDVVLLEGTTGNLFEEVFTHDGAGILFNALRSAQIRAAELRDVTDIALLLRPEVEAGRIRPVSEADIERNLAYYRVYEIDGLLVGLARLKPYGETAELSQFATLPRYRGKGRARELALALIEEARRLDFRSVFALSIDERMWEFFQALGFRPVARESLPEGWLRGYDLNRPSRAFLKEL